MDQYQKTFDYEQFLNELYKDKPSNGRTIALELNVADHETNTYDLFEFLLNTLVEGFIRLHLNVTLDSLQYLDKYFNMFGLIIVVEPFTPTNRTTGVTGATGVNAYCCLTNGLQIALYKNHARVEHLQDIKAIYEQYAVNFTYI